MNKFRFHVWIKALRLPFSSATLIPVILGAVIAWSDTGNFLWQPFFITMFGALLIHLGTNLANDYFDHISGCDENNNNFNNFSGGSRVIQDNLIEPKAILYASLIFFLLGSIIGIYLNHICRGNIILIFGLTGIFLGFFYTAKPLRIGYGSLGEISTGIGFGPLMVMGAYYVQAQQLPLKIFLTSIPIGILISLVLFINEFPDYNSDKAVGKRTWVVILGKQKAIKIYHIFIITTYFYISSLIILKIIPYFCFIIFLSFPLAIKAIKISRVNYDRFHELLPANACTIGLHCSIGILMASGYFLNHLI